MGRKPKEDNFEMDFYLGVVEKAPRFIEALSILGDLFTKKGRYKEGLEIDERLVNIRPNDPIVLYNLACSYSILNEVKKSLRSLKKAINCGYDNFSFLEQDNDLLNLRKDPGFKKYYSRISESKKTKNT